MKIAIIRVRGLPGVREDIHDTMKMLRLYRKNYCVVVEDTSTNLGMIQMIKDYVTFGEIDEDTYSMLIQKKAEEYKGRTSDSKNIINYKFLKLGDKKLKPFFRLSPPKGGFERKGIKKDFKSGGALGYRGNKINDLIKRMV